MYKSLSILILSLFITGCTIEYNKNAKHIQIYELKAFDDYSKDGKKKMRWFIDAPEALSKEQRAYTAYEAAQDCKVETSAVECTIYLIATQNAYVFGDLFYSVLVLDENDKPTVHVSDIKLTKTQYNIAYYYTKLKTTYQNAKPEEFKKAFYTVMIDKLKIPENELILPQIKREEFIIIEE